MSPWLIVLLLCVTGCANVVAPKMPPIQPSVVTRCHAVIESTDCSARRNMFPPTWCACTLDV